MSSPNQTPTRKAASGGSSPKQAPIDVSVPRAAKAVADKTKAVATTPVSIFAQRTESVQRLVRDSMSEMKKINWPDQETTKSLTVLVIAISVVLGLLLGGIDFLLAKLLNVF